MLRGGVFSMVMIVVLHVVSFLQWQTVNPLSRDTRLMLPGWSCRSHSIAHSLHSCMQPVQASMQSMVSWLIVIFNLLLGGRRFELPT
jgi:hypothetical protein